MCFINVLKLSFSVKSKHLNIFLADQNIYTTFYQTYTHIRFLAELLFSRWIFLLKITIR